MKITKDTVVRLSYEMYVAGEKEGTEELWEKAPLEHPLVYCHGENMMLPAFEFAMEGHEAGDKFDFRIAYSEAYGDYDEKGVISLDKKMFYNGDGEFDSERVYVGAIVPMNTADGQIVNAQIAEINDTTVTIDLNHPLAGEDLHFVVEIQDVREATADELEAVRNPGCHGCHGKKKRCGNNGGCGDGGCDGGCEGDCGEGGCGGCK